ncbi:MAG: ribonuclease HIII [Candidatus Cloacimonetes bacterium]|nr:ribonuclease HIII [Candidatus Cloacimonadota bacterium]
MDKHIESALAQLLPELARHGISVSSQRELQYGLQLRLERDAETATLNLYWSLKKGISQVLAGKPNRLKADLAKLLNAAEAGPVGDFHTWERWIGSDECGKGDYFGALVVAAFALDAEKVDEIRSLGVLDSKKLTDIQVRDIAHNLYSRFPERIACIVIKPLRYNEIMADRQSRGENLNDLLAWQHGTAIMELLVRIPLVQGVLVDQFSLHKKVSKYLKNKEIGIPVEERPKAEADPAVAAASIIARYQFLQSRQAMDRHYKMSFPLGSGKNVLPPAKAFADKYGWDRLAEVAKLHFVTSRGVRVKDIFDPPADK